jgi:hypothetical protein
VVDNEICPLAAKEENISEDEALSDEFAKDLSSNSYAFLAKLGY